MSSDGDLEKLKHEVGQTVGRIEALQKRNNGTVGARIQRHIKSNSSQLINILLAGCAFAIAVNNLSAKYAHEEEQRKAQEQLKQLELEHDRCTRQAAAAKDALARLKEGVREEAQSKGWWGSSSSARLLNLLDNLDQEGLKSAVPGAEQSPLIDHAVSPAPAEAGQREKKMMI